MSTPSSDKEQEGPTTMSLSSSAGGPRAAPFMSSNSSSSSIGSTSSGGGGGGSGSAGGGGGGGGRSGSSTRVGMPRQRSKGQIARRHSITRGSASAREAGSRRARGGSVGAGAGAGPSTEAGAGKGKATKPRGRPPREMATTYGTSVDSPGDILLSAPVGQIAMEGRNEIGDDDDDDEDEDDEECKTGGGACEQMDSSERSRGAGDDETAAAAAVGRTADKIQSTEGGPKVLTSRKGSEKEPLLKNKDGTKKKSLKKRRQRQQQPSADVPWLGGLFFTDLIFIAFTYAINLLRTCGLAELFDVAFKGFVYVLFSLPSDLYRRWTLSAASPAVLVSEQTRARRRNRAKAKRNEKRRDEKLVEKVVKSEIDVPAPASTTSDQDASATEAELISRSQLSPFHHLIVLVARFACANFPHLLPRVLFAEETIGPFVYWRTGGGSNTMVQEFTDVHDIGRRRQLPASAGGSSSQEQSEDEGEIGGGFKAYLLSTDAKMPIEVQRANVASRKATTLLYLHGGGFSLGSVAFYAEALLRLRAKIAAIEAVNGVLARDMAEPRCVAVEYDLSPTARFPTPLLQCLRCYAHLIEVEHVDPDSICIAGDSAGGNLAMGMLLCLAGRIGSEYGDGVMKERDWSKLPLPGKACLISPWVDLRPKKSIAFRNLRQQYQDKRKQARGETVKQHESNKATEEGAERDDEWTEAVAAYDWDYVASESLLHFAQVYTGILEAPRRVRGPLGWIAHVCGVFADEQEKSPPSPEPEKRKGGMKGSAKEVDEKASKQAYSKGFILDPRRALAAALASPSAKLARAAHDVLSEPLLSKLLNTAAPPSQPSSGNSGAVMPAQEPSAFEPLFTPSERRTELVTDMGELYNDDHFQTKEGMSEESQEQQQARRWLDGHPLLSPTIGDWSSIRLKHGYLVTWGERERMADDIALWVKQARRSMARSATTSEAKGKGKEHGSQTTTNQEEEEEAKVTKDAGSSREDVTSFVHKDSRPVKKKSTKPQEQPSPVLSSSSSSSSSTSSSSKGHDGAEESRLIYSAIERGPGGVHAWPFVSMYLAGSESEREKGLDLVAHFTAKKTEPEQSLATANYIAARATKEGEGEEAEPEQDDIGSPGSMPSDVDLHGYAVDENDVDVEGDFELDQAFLDDDLQDIESSDLVVNIADAVKRAKELGVGLQDDEDMKDQNLANVSPGSGKSGTSFQSSQPQDQGQGNELQQRRQGAALRAKLEADMAEMAERQRQHLQQTRYEVRQRGRSRSPRRTAAAAAGLTPSPSLDSPTSPFMPRISTPTGMSPSPSTPSQLQLAGDTFFPPVQLHMPSHVAASPHRVQQQQQQQQQQQTRASAVVNPSVMSNTVGSPYKAVSQQDRDEERQREIAELQRQQQAQALQRLRTVPSASASTSLPRTMEGPGLSSLNVAAASPDDEELVSPADTSQSSSLGLEDQEEEEELEDEDVCEEGIAIQQPDIGFYGMSQYSAMMRRRAEPEGLSDIAEEDSNLSASITSAGPASPSDRNLSPARGGNGGGSGNGNGGYQPPQSLSAAVLMREQEWRAALERAAATAGRSAGIEGSAGEDEEGVMSEEQGDTSEELLATSPPSGAQPGPSIPLVAGASPRLSSSSSSSSSTSLAKRSQKPTTAGEEGQAAGEEEKEDGGVGQDDGTMSQSSSSSTITRKRPKGDVWW